MGLGNFDQVRKKGTSAKGLVMEWLKIFGNPEEARKRIPEGKTQLLIVRGKRICLARSNDHFYAVQNSCPHNGGSLSEGTVNYIGEIVCPWHGYRYSLRTGVCAQQAPDVETFPVREDDQGLFIGT
jgi:nitrite reductase/ring-hydroxylating ferredoxin subunit